MVGCVVEKGWCGFEIHGGEIEHAILCFRPGRQLTVQEYLAERVPGMTVQRALLYTDGSYLVRTPH